MLSDKDPKIIQWRKDSVLNKWRKKEREELRKEAKEAGKERKKHTRNFDPFLIPYATQNASQNLNVKPKVIKSLQEVIRDNLVTLG